MDAKEVINIEKLVRSIQETNQYFLNQAQKQVNTALTLRNWVIGFYIIEYEQHGEDRAAYGQRLYKEIAAKLKKEGVSSIRERHLYLCKDFYKAYPHILQTASAKLYLNDLQGVVILRTASAKSVASENVTNQSIAESAQTAPDLLLSRLSFSHFIELLKSDTLLKRNFYEIETIKNNWSVRDLQRAINSMLFERTGLSSDKHAIFHADAGQMNVYLNYYKEHEMNEGDNPPVGIILCANKNENLVRYATAGLPQQVFVSKYLINLPSETELAKIIEEEQYKLEVDI
ncbi:PDDEXK nuclease domain-containing protein [Chitinophaga flava]|uniref:DUF1016 domain-containing protein n=1 Tax=Chitinophaga flava TaxID=2259036 RepID=A0A365Y2H7_9BACT|nr:PDDEXK nuclease domain-containing protein [Chitinophaga flava]RBL92451.1 hypothetical protein DF182_07675 [Chitinophaga flava]